jgi:biopolymer transport protein ExbD
VIVSHRSRLRLALFAATALASLCACGDDAPSGVPVGPPVTLPIVTAAAPLPGADRSATVTLSSRDGPWVDGKPVVRLRELLAALRERASALPHHDDGSSFLEVVIRADDDTPFAAVAWTLQAMADEHVQAARAHFEVRHRASGEIGALAWTMPMDCGPPWRGDPPPQIAIRVSAADVGAPSSPELVYRDLVRRREKDPRLHVVFEFAKGTQRGTLVRYGTMMRMLDAVQRAGVGRIDFMGFAAPKSSDPKTSRDDWDLRAAIADLAALPPGVPVIQIDGKTIPSDSSPPIPDGPSPNEIAVQRGPPPPLPPMRKPGANAQTETGVAPEPPAEEELPPTPEETEQVHAHDEVAKEPTVKDAELTDHDEADSDPPNEDAVTHAIGAFRSRSQHGVNVRSNGGAHRADDAVEDALKWLAAHQSADGGWECEGFRKWCDGKITSGDGPDGAGRAEHDVGTTGLALLSFLGAGYTQRSDGPFGKVVANGLRYLRNAQDAEGCFGSRTAAHYIYSHAISALAMVEAFAMTGSTLYKNSAQKALDFIAISRNPYFAWRYGVKPGDNDTSVTCWMMAVLHSAQLVNRADEKNGKPSSLIIDVDQFEGARAWLDKMTDPDYGRVGYQQRGAGPARPGELVDKFPADKSESLTAAAILSRVFLGDDPRTSDVIRRGANLLAKLPPVWNTTDGSIDMHYWYFATMATFQLGGERWTAWEAAMKPAMIDTQHRDTDYCKLKGSWDPIDPWGADGGRVYATAMMAMCLEVWYRYEHVALEAAGGK